MPWVDLAEDVAELFDGFDDALRREVTEALERRARFLPPGEREQRDRQNLSRRRPSPARYCARCGREIRRDEHNRRRYCKGGCPGQAPAPRACRRCGKPIPDGRRGNYCADLCSIIGRKVIFRPMWA